MKIQFRVINIRKHKTVEFLDGISNAKVIQFMISKELLADIVINVGDIVATNSEYGQNNTGKTILIISEIISITHPNKVPTYALETEDIKRIKELQCMLGRKNGTIWVYKNQLRVKIEDYLSKAGMQNYISSIVMNERGTSIAKPLECFGDFIEKKYLKITHELELKKASILTMSSVYDFSYVFRDAYETTKNISQILLLEGVILSDDDQELIKLIFDFVRIAIDLAKEYKIEYDVRFEELEVIDISYIDSIYNMESYKAFLRSIRHPSILVNAPIDSPFVKPKDGDRREIKFVCDGIGMFHGYLDEIDFNTIKSAFDIQQEMLRKNGTDAKAPRDYIRLLEYGSPQTVSFGFGYDRFLEKILMLNSIGEIAHIIGI